MSARTLLVLSLLVALLAAALFLLPGRRSPNPAAAQNAAPILSSLDVNDINRLEILSASSTCTLARTSNSWTVAEMFGYYADFDELSRLLRSLADATIGQLVPDGTNYLSEFGLDMQKVTGSRAAALRLHTPDRRPLTIHLGSEWVTSAGENYPSYPRGRYIRINDGPVILVADTLPVRAPDPAKWIDRSILDVPPSKVSMVTVNASNTHYTLKVTAPDAFELDPMPAGKELDRAAVHRLLRSMQHLQCISVADPALKDEALGLDNPVVFKLHTSDGFTYTALIGKDAPDNRGRYARFEVSYQPPPPPDLEKIRAELRAEDQKKLTKNDESASASSEKKNDTSPKKDLEERARTEYQKRLDAYNDKVHKQQNIARDTAERLRDWTFIISHYDSATFTLPHAGLLRAKKSSPKSPKKQ